MKSLSKSCSSLGEPALIVVLWENRNYLGELNAVLPRTSSKIPKNAYAFHKMINYSSPKNCIAVLPKNLFYGTPLNFG